MSLVRTIIICCCILFTSSAFSIKKVLFLEQENISSDLKLFHTSLLNLLENDQQINITNRRIGFFSIKDKNRKAQYVLNNNIDYVLTYGVKRAHVLGEEKFTFYIDLYTKKNLDVSLQKSSSDTLHFEWEQKISQYNPVKGEHFIEHVNFFIKNGYRKKDVLVIKVEMRIPASIVSEEVRDDLEFLKDIASKTIAKNIEQSEHEHAKRLTKNFFFKTEEHAVESHHFAMNVKFVLKDSKIHVSIKYNYPRDIASRCILDEIRYESKKEDEFFKKLVQKMMEKCQLKLIGHS